MGGFFQPNPRRGLLRPFGWLCLLCALAPAVTAAGLAVAKTSLHQYEGGPPVPASFEFFPGDTVFLTFRIGGFATVERNDEERLQLSYKINAYDPGGLTLKEETEGAASAELTPQDKKQKWMPLVRYDVLVPPAAPSGDYKIVIAVEDKLGHATTSAEVPFKVKGPDIEPSDTLVLRNFHFYGTETSLRPMRDAVYRPGDSVWARFDITGYRFGENNRFAIEYGIKVLRASGKVLFEQPVAATEERESHYPERHIQGGLSLNLTSDLTPGAYTIIVTVRDQVGAQTYEESHVFHVR